MDGAARPPYEPCIATRAHRGFADKRAVSDASEEEAFSRQAVIRVGDRHSGHTERSCELAARRQSIAGAKHAVDNRVAYLPVDLRAQIPSADQADVHRHGVHCMSRRWEWSTRWIVNWLYRQSF